jgi:hypothetical protein
MHLLATGLLVLAVWTVVALPIAMFVGRFLRVGAGLPGQATGSTPRGSMGRAA